MLNHTHFYWSNSTLFPYKSYIRWKLIFATLKVSLVVFCIFLFDKKNPTKRSKTTMNWANIVHVSKAWCSSLLFLPYCSSKCTAWPLFDDYGYCSLVWVNVTKHGLMQEKTAPNKCSIYSCLTATVPAVFSQPVHRQRGVAMETETVSMPLQDQVI